MIRLSEQNGGVFQNVDKVVEKVGKSMCGGDKGGTRGGEELVCGVDAIRAGCIFITSPLASVDTFPSALAFDI